MCDLETCWSRRYESNVGNGAVDAATCNVQLDKEERSGLHLITLAAESKRGQPTHDVGMINISMMPNAEKRNEKIKGNETLSSRQNDDRMISCQILHPLTKHHSSHI